MKVLLINGSPRNEGNTFFSLTEAATALENEGIETEIISIGNKPIRGCIGCNKCRENGDGCIFNDDLYTKIRECLKVSDGLIVGSPVYFAGPNGSLCALLDRVFYSCGKDLFYKPGASVAVCRRGGASATFDRLNKYFTIRHMPLVSSQYWNILHGYTPGQVSEDKEGLQTMRTLGRNMAWLLKNIENGKVERPKPEEPQITSFIR